MNIEGLDYNTQRDKLVLPEYGREIQKMVEHAIGLPTKEERQRCAETIVSIMARMNPQHRESGDYMQKLWDHLAIMSGFRLDIDYPYDVSQALKLAGKPEPVSYPTKVNSVRHYGRMMGDMFEKLKTMEPGAERDALTALAANQMKRSLVLWSHGSCDDEKVASDLARLTDGVIQLDLSTFKFRKIENREQAEPKRKRR